MKTVQAALVTNVQDLERLAVLVRERNLIESEIAGLIGRPALTGHIGEFIASVVFDISLHESASHRSTDGVFASGALVGRTVNVKLYGKHESMLDLPKDGLDAADLLLVLAGPRANPGSSAGATRPLAIASVHLFESATLLTAQRERRVKIGVATSVARRLWDGAELFPRSQSPLLQLDDEQRRLLQLFASVGG